MGDGEAEAEAARCELLIWGGTYADFVPSRPRDAVGWHGGIVSAVLGEQRKVVMRTKLRLETWVAVYNSICHIR